MNSTSHAVRGCGLVRISLAVVCLYWFGWTPACRAATYYVDANNPSASDTNPGTEARPWKTIGKATSLVKPGDTVFVKAGVYREIVILSRSGTAANPITIAAFPGDEGKVVINAAEPVTTGQVHRAGRVQRQSELEPHLLGGRGEPRGCSPGQGLCRSAGLPARRAAPSLPLSGYPLELSHRRHGPQDHFSDSTLSKPAGYFNGAVCHIKTALWQIDQIPIASSSGSTIMLASEPR